MDKKVQPMTDDAELAKVLEGMQDSVSTVAPPAPSAAQPASAAGLSFEETPQTAAQPAAQPVAQSAAPSLDPLAAMMPPAPAAPATPEFPAMPAAPAASAGDPGLESIKKDALEQLRPLVDKLNLPADEKFDTLLLIIRSTDDKSLVSAAYNAARTIEDESKRAEALLDIIKEIDYFNNPAAGQPQL